MEGRGGVPRPCRSTPETRSTSAGLRRTSTEACGRARSLLPGQKDSSYRSSRMFPQPSPAQEISHSRSDGKEAIPTHGAKNKFYLLTPASSAVWPLHVPYDRQRTHVNEYSASPVSGFADDSMTSSDWQR